MARGFVVDTLKYRMELEKKKFDQDVKSVDQGVDKLSRGLEGKLVKALGAVGAAFAAINVANFLKNVTLTAARTEVLGTVLNQVGRVSGYSEEQLKAYENAVKSMGITTQESRMALIRMMQSQLDLADAAKLARTAQDLAVISGQNSSEALGTIIEAISAQRPILLKQFGIVKDLTEVYSDAAKAAGKNAEQLTEWEKKQAFVDVILTEGAKVAGTYEEAMRDVGKQLTSMPRYFEELANAIGNVFKPALSHAIKGLTDFVKGATDAILRTFDPMEYYQQQLIKFEQGIAGHAPKIMELANQYQALEGATDLTAKEQAKLRDVIQELGALVPEAVTQFDEYGKALGINVEMVRSLVGFYEKLQKQTELKIFKESESQLQKATKQYEEWHGHVVDYRQELEQLSKYNPKDFVILDDEDMGYFCGQSFAA